MIRSITSTTGDAQSWPIVNVELARRAADARGREARGLVELSTSNATVGASLVGPALVACPSRPVRKRTPSAFSIGPPVATLLLRGGRFPFGHVAGSHLLHPTG